MVDQFIVDCCLMAGGAYLSNRDDKNKFPIPEGWSTISNSHVNLSSGFEAVSFQSGNSIVISFADTNPVLYST